MVFYQAAALFKFYAGIKDGVFMLLKVFVL